MRGIILYTLHLHNILADSILLSIPGIYYHMLRDETANKRAWTATALVTNSCKIMSLDKRLYILLQYPDDPCVGCVDSHRLDTLLSNILQVMSFSSVMEPLITTNDMMS